MPTRRGLITGLIALVSSPAIVRCESLMGLRGVPLAVELETAYEASYQEVALGYTITRRAIEQGMYGFALAQLKAEGALIEYDNLLDVATVAGPADDIERWHRATLESRLKG